jgi:hypothetical protein
MPDLKHFAIEFKAAPIKASQIPYVDAKRGLRCALPRFRAAVILSSGLFEQNRSGKRIGRPRKRSAMTRSSTFCREIDLPVDCRTRGHFTLWFAETESRNSSNRRSQSLESFCENLPFLIFAISQDCREEAAQAQEQEGARWICPSLMPAVADTRPVVVAQSSAMNGPSCKMRRVSFAR